MLQHGPVMIGGGAIPLCVVVFRGWSQDQGGEREKHPEWLSHSASSARAVVSPMKEHHSVDFKTESL